MLRVSVSQLFRCQGKKGSFTAETTVWEGTPLAVTPTETGGPQGQGVHMTTPAQVAAKNNISG